MRLSDLDRILEIEHESFPNPWTRTAFTGHLQHPEFAKYLVAKADDRIVGYTGLFFGGGQGQITNLAVEPRWRRHGVAADLLTTVFEEAWRLGLERMSLEVRVSNDPAQTLYEKLGFTKVGVRKNYYREIGEDAYVMCIFNINDDRIVRKVHNLKEGERTA